MLRPLLILVLCLFATETALAETRVALVIGNAAYKHAPELKNPRHDAEAIGALLKQLGFEVVLGVDLDESGMRRELQAFSAKLDNATVALVYFAGHGLQVHGRNYLMPVDSKLERESDLIFQGVMLDQVQRLLEQSQRINILILDSCRDNPLAKNLARAMGTRSNAIGRGMGANQSGVGTLIVYATQPDNVALDGDKQRHSPFAEALIAHIATPGLEVRQMLTRVRASVIKATNGKQVPWVSESMTSDFFFAAAPASGPDKAPPPSPTTVPEGEVVFWQSIKDSKNAADFRDYLKRWPNGLFADLARRRLADLEAVAARDRAAAEGEKRADDEQRRQEEEARKRAEQELRQAEEERRNRERQRAQDERRRRADMRRHERGVAPRLSRADIPGYLHLAYLDSLARLLSARVGQSGDPRIVGSTNPYRHLAANKALAACVDWTASTPDSLRYKAWGYSGRQGTIEEARRGAQDWCLRSAGAAGCTCVVIDENDRNVLTFPPSFVATHFQ
jgi:uncharacterized caspase-like protein